jgi:glycosyltransferase involved in cell wall biosynthesis
MGRNEQVNMRVVHLSTRDGLGGAFRGTYTLHQALRQIGIDSQMLVARKYGQDPTVHLPTMALLSRLLHGWRMWRELKPLEAYPKRTDLLSPVVISANLRPALRRLAPDLIHLHWVVQGFVKPSDLATWRRPLVWTLRDMWAFTGGCHYSDTCDRYRGQCGCCPKLGSQNDNDLTRDLWRRKEASWSKLTIHFVAISSWLADCAREASLCAGHPVQVIPNAIDTELFTPMPKSAARAHLNLSADKKIVLYGAVQVDDERKGYSYCIEALHKLAQPRDFASLQVVTFGNGDTGKMQAIPISQSHLGYLSDDTMLAALYSAADVMVVPSLEEAFGKTAAEALACGTPVVCFDSSGLKDIVEHQQCGYRAQPFSSDDLANGIAWVLSDDERHAALAQRGRAKVVEEFSLGSVAEQYRQLYSRIIDG